MFLTWFSNLSFLFGNLWVFKCGFMLWGCTSRKLSSDWRHILKFPKASSLQNAGQSSLAFVTGKKVYNKCWIGIILFTCIIHTVLFTYFILCSYLIAWPGKDFMHGFCKSYGFFLNFLNSPKIRMSCVKCVCCHLNFYLKHGFPLNIFEIMQGSACYPLLILVVRELNH